MRPAAKISGGTNWYDAPLYYDIIFDADTGLEASFLEVMYERHGRDKSRGRRRSVLEPACGTGRLIRSLTSRGWNVSGFDANPSSLAFARDRLARENLKAHLWEDRMESFRVQSRHRFDLAHCLVSTFKYLQNEEDAFACMRRVADVLRPGGLFVLGIHLTDYSNPRVNHERWVASRAGIEVVCNTRSWPADREKRREKLRSRIRATHPDGQKVSQETCWEFRTYSAKQIQKLLARIPSLTLVACHDFRYDPGEERELNDSYSDAILVLRRE